MDRIEAARAEYERARKDAVRRVEALGLPGPVPLAAVVGFLPENPEWRRYGRRRKRRR